MNLIEIVQACKETLLMTVISIVLSYIIGLPLGIILNVTSKDGLKPSKWINKILGTVVNIFRSIPCLLLIIVLIPLSNVILGKGSWSGGWYSMIIPLTFASFGFVSRMVEQSLKEVSSGVVEAAKSLGCSDYQIIKKVLLREAKASLISGFAVTTVSIIGYTSFAGYIAGGGLICLAFNYGYYGTNKLGMWLCISIIVIIVQVIQELGLKISKKSDKR